MAHANLIGVESIDNGLCEVSHFQSRSYKRRMLSYLGGDLLNAVLRLLQCQKPRETFGLFHRVNFGSNQILD
jgi:hypothetical protein